MYQIYVVPLLLLLSVFTISGSKIDGKSDPSDKFIRFWNWGTANPVELISTSPVPFCEDSNRANICPNGKKICEARQNIQQLYPFPTMEVRVVYSKTGKSRSHITVPTTTNKPVYLPSNLPISGEYEYVEPPFQTTEDTSPITPQKKSTDKKRKSNKTTLATTVGIAETNSSNFQTNVASHQIITYRPRRHIRNPYDFNLRYMLYPMNPDFYMAMEQSRQAESKVRNQENMKKAETSRNRRKTNYFSIPNLQWRSNLDRRLLKRHENFKINKPFL